MQNSYRVPQKREFALCIVFLLAFLLIAIFRSSLHTVDAAINSWMPTIQSANVTVWASAIDFAFDTNSLVVYSVIIAAALFVRGRKQMGLFLVGAMSGAAVIVTITKNIEQITRPANAILVKSGFSFPSGHSAGIVVMLGILIFFAWEHWTSTRVRASIVGAYSAMIGIVCFDRVYLNAHWFSDVLAGALSGAFWLLFLILLYKWLGRRGTFDGPRFNIIANLLYVGAIVIAVLVVVSGAIV